jgi:hypothetical protein
MKRRRLPELDYLGDESSGPWAMSKTEEKPAEIESIQEQEKAAEEKEKEKAEQPDEKSEPKDPTMHILEPEEEDEMWEKVNERKMGYVLPPRPARGSKVRSVYWSDFHLFLA